MLSKGLSNISNGEKRIELLDLTLPKQTPRSILSPGSFSEDSRLFCPKLKGWINITTEKKPRNYRHGSRNSFPCPSLIENPPKTPKEQKSSHPPPFIFILLYLFVICFYDYSHYAHRNFIMFSFISLPFFFFNVIYISSDSPLLIKKKKK